MITRKRKLEDSETFHENKKHKVEIHTNEREERVILNSQSISGTQIHNYFLNNTLVDWLKLYYQSNILNPSTSTINEHKIEPKKDYNLQKYIMNQGNEFESVIVTRIKEKIESSGHICDNKDFVEISKSDYTTMYNNTIDSMKSGVGIIYQGFLYNSDNNTYGYPDLIVRSDILNRLIKNKPVSVQHGCKFSNKWHYRIVDIKFTTIGFRVNGDCLLKRGYIHAYKGQLLIYNLALSKIQEYNPQTSYILGRGWKQDKESVSEPFDRLGFINYLEEDKAIPDILNLALEWVRTVRSQGRNWSINPPTRSELYPNMKHTDEWIDIKRQIAQNIGEITLIWNCGVKHRNIAHKKGIYSWTDTRFNSGCLNMKGTKIAPRIDSILYINKNNTENGVQYDLNYTSNNNSNNNWRYNPDAFTVYLDFETYSNIHKLENHCGSEGIYLIGNGYIENNLWKFKHFLIEDNTNIEECKIVEEWLQWLSVASSGYESSGYESRENKPINIYHYHSIEFNYFNKVINKYNLRHKYKSLIKRIHWIDLFKIVYNYSVVIRGCFDFSLKSIVSGLASNGIIQNVYESLIVKDGSDAMVSLYEGIRIKNQTGCKLSETECIKNSIIYNEKDTQSLYLLIGVLDELII